MQLPLEGRAVSRVAFDHAVSLLTDDGAELRIQTTIGFAPGPARSLLIDPEDDARLHAEDLVGLRGAVISEATAADDGTLELRTSAGAMLQVTPDPSFEAWTLTGADGRSFVCLPGGGMAVWDRRDR